MHEDDDGQQACYVGAGAERGGGDVEGQAFRVAEGVLRVREGVLEEEEVLAITVFRVGDGERARKRC